MVTAVSDKKKKALRLLDMLATIVRYKKNAVVLIATYSTAAFFFACTCALLCKLLRIPYVPCLHGGNLPERIKASPVLARTYFGRSKINIAVSGYLQQPMLANGWRCIVIPNCINSMHYPFRQRLAASPKLLWVRSFHKVYNPQMAILVVHELRKVYAEATLTMVGPDKDGSLAQCATLAAGLGVENQIVFTGILPQKEWIQLAAKCDIFINTTNADNLPVSVIEAMALGMIIISTNAGGLPFLIQHEINGLLVKTNDVATMTSSIVKVCNDASMASTLSTGGYTTAQSFKEANVVQLWRNFLNGL